MVTILLRGLLALVFAATATPSSPSGSVPSTVSPSETASKARASGARNCSTALVTLDNGDLDQTRAKGLNYITMEPWEAGRIPALRRANPGIKILMYQNLSSVRNDRHESGLSSTGLNLDEMREDWLLHSQDGSPARWADYPDLYAVNIAKPGYQQAWLASVLGRLRNGGWDGVMLDDTLTRLSHPLVGGGVPREISTDEAMYQATDSALRYLGPRIQEAGFLAVPNLTTYWDSWQRPTREWTPLVSGWEQEFLVKWGLEKMERLNVTNDWLWKLQMAREIARDRKILIGITYSNRRDKATQLYHRATWLLSWNGRNGASAFVPYEYGVNHFTKWANMSIGQPKSGMKTKPNGLYLRRYSRGIAIVNPTTKPLRVVLSKPMRRSNGKAVRTFTLKPTSGELLYKRRAPKHACG